MKAELYTNCSLVRVPIHAGEDKVYLPQNVDWAAQKIEKMLILAPTNPCTDPIDGITPVMTTTDLTDCYINLYDADGNELMHDVLVENILHINNNPLYVNGKIDISLSFLSFNTAPATDATLLLYVFYGTREEEYAELPKRSVTVEFPLDADEKKSFQEIINTYVHALPSTIKGIICWNAISAPAYITLRDTKLTYQMANVHSELMRPDTNGHTAYDTQAALFLTNDLDIDFEYSDIRNATSTPNTQKITFLF